jgi:transketolase
MATATPDSPAASGPIAGASARDQLAINAVRVLSMDAVQQADSGHPGTPMALAPIAYALWTRHMKYNPEDPGWPDRDRFVLSCGHASMLHYSVLHLTGYDLSLDDLQQFRQWESKTPGHPEYGYTPGVETTTGPLGQGVGNAVGFAVAEAHMARCSTAPGHAVVDHHTYFICSDGDLMEGVSHEAASFAGHNRLGKLVGFYDDNRITIEGSTDLTYTDDAASASRRTAGTCSTSPTATTSTPSTPRSTPRRPRPERPSLIVVRTVIGYGSPNRANSAKAHGEPLGKDEIVLTKQKLGWPSTEPFVVPDEAVAPWRDAGAAGAAKQAEWQARYDAWKAAFPDLAAEFERRQHGRLADGWEASIPDFTADNGNVASRAASGVVLNAIAPAIPELIGGSADLAGSTNTLIKNVGSFGPQGVPTPETSYGGRNFHWGSASSAWAPS